MEKIIYSKYSNERRRQFAIRTDIRETPEGRRAVVKRACYPEGKSHIENMEKWYRMLGTLLKDTPFSMNTCTMQEECARFEYLEGRTLEERLDGLLLLGKQEEAIAFLTEYAGQVRAALSGARFVKTPAFVQVFGDVQLKGELACAPVTDLDMVLGNVLEHDGKWTLLDYEWSFDFPIPADYVIYRALKYYMYGNQIRAALQEKDLYAMAGVGRENQRAFEKMEEHFQAYVRGDVVIMAKLYDQVSPGYIATGTAAEKRAHARGSNLRFEVFFDRGSGFSAQDSYDILFSGTPEVSLDIAAKEDVRKIRLDPPVDYCTVWLKSAVWKQNGREKTPRYVSNGTELRRGLFLFAAEDAQIIFEGLHGGGELKLELVIEPCDKNALLAQFAAGSAKHGPALRDARKLKKTAAKGIAYFKKNGVRATLKRGVAKARLAKPADYPAWLKKQRLDDKTLDEMRKTYRRQLACIKAASLKELPKIDADCYYLLIAEGGELEKGALELYAQSMAQNPGAELFYCDSDRLAKDGSFCMPCLKPDFDDTLLYSTNYIGAGFLVSGRLLRECEDALRCGPEEAALYEVLLSCAKEAKEIVHVPKVLYHERQQNGNRAASEDRALADAEKKALEAFLKRRHIHAQILDGARERIRRVRYVYEDRPLVSVLIPNKDNVIQLSRCLHGIQKFAGYENLEILILENNSTEPETFRYYAELTDKAQERVRVLTFDGAFDYSAVNNFGARQAAGDYLLFLNNDAEMCADGCVRELLNYAMQEDVGAVGAHMYYPDGGIQHAGVIVGYGGVAGHAFEGFDKKRQEETLWIQTARQYSAVTAACMMVKKELFLSLGGFCGDLGIAYNDVDLCLRIRKSGKKVIYTPYAELIHRESQTRGFETTKEKAKRVRREAAFFCARWKDVLRKGDPCYNPNLTLEKPDFSLRR